MATLLIETVKYFATTENEAEGLVSTAKKEYGNSIKKHSITKKEKVTKDDYFEYFIVDITVEHQVVKNLLN